MTELQLAARPPAAAPARRSDRSGDIRTLQYGRGIAALLVVLFHSNLLAAKYFGETLEGSAFRGGHSGVEFFFVLSGFIILAAHRGDVGRRDRLRAYVLKRLIRVMPLFWLVVIPYGLVFLLVPSMGAERALTPFKLALDLLLVPREGGLTLPPAWTLQHEALFYAVFAAAILDARLGVWLFVLWQGACCVVLAFSLTPQDYLLPVNTLVGFYNFGFAFGLSLAFAWGRGLIGRYARSAVALGWCGALGIVGLLAEEARGASPVFGTPAAASLAYFACYAAIIAGLLSVPNIRRPVLDATLGLLGSASYAIYLVHLPIGSVVLKVLTRPGLVPLVGPHSAFLAVVAVALAAGVLVHLMVERPLHRWLRSRLLGRSGRSAVSAYEVRPSPLSL